MSRIRVAVTLHGTVQGVGMRPWLHRRATALQLAGWAANAADGVALELEGRERDVARLLEELSRAPPAHARITRIERAPRTPVGEQGFSIRASIEGAGAADVPVDLATCADCLRELRDPCDRRYRYPFINCTQCGPRFSIIERLPYDRARTGMRGFALCTACRREYEDPGNRRFHAEPIACPDCGPRLALRRSAERLATGEAALQQAIAALRDGAIVAVKGVGGFHLLADAGQEAAVAALRTRKGRGEKPFAVLFPDLAAVRAVCAVSDLEAAQLASAAAPIVLLRRAGGEAARSAEGGASQRPVIAPSVAPGHALLGAMLPYSPIHHLLCDALARPLVATSCNRSDEPIAFADDDPRPAQLGDLVLDHDRPILRGIDDSVVRVIGDCAVVLRHARGLAPASFASAVPLPAGIVALGGHLKTALAVTRRADVVLGPHLGDLDSPAARARHAQAAAGLTALLGLDAAMRVGDLHPDYASSGRIDRRVQHHLAHVVACLADSGAPLPVLGVAFDGGGDGGDATVWGGEFLEVRADGWRRIGALRTFPLPGGEAAVREPRRAALGLLHASFGAAALECESLAPIAAFTRAERRVLGRMLERGLHSPRTSSVGRLFDALAALAGMRQVMSYEGQAAAEFEALAETAEADGMAPLPFALRERAGQLELDWQPALESALRQLRAGGDVAALALAFHEGLAAAIVAVARRVALRRVALTGGCFQNALLTVASARALTAAGFEPLRHERVPPNDGGLALGQALWTAWREADAVRERSRSCA
jgi:hydrogenase maturation protein HypF